jgi:hypothetical protein
VIWSPDNQGLANVRIDMLKFRKSDNTVLAATHGRGMYTTIWQPVYTSSIQDESISSADIQVFPNPTAGLFEVKLDNPANADLTIMDIAGRIVIQSEIKEQTGTWQKSFNLTKEPKGIYLVRVASKGKSEVTRLIVE